MDGSDRHRQLNQLTSFEQLSVSTNDAPSSWLTAECARRAKIRTPSVVTVGRVKLAGLDALDQVAWIDKSVRFGQAYATAHSPLTDCAFLVTDALQDCHCSCSLGKNDFGVSSVLEESYTRCHPRTFFS